jgi:hypothetical protein
VSKHGDEDFSMVFPSVYEPTTDQQRLMTDLTLDSAVELERQLDEAGGVPLGSELLRIQLEGRRNQEITVVDIRPKIIARAAPLDGTLFEAGSEGVATTRVGIDFDERAPLPREVPEDDGSFDAPETWGDPYFENFTIKLEDKASEDILIGIIATRYYIEFDLVLPYTLGGATQTRIINNDGRHFRISGANCISDTLMKYRRGFINGYGGGWGLKPVPNPSRIRNEGCIEIRKRRQGA